MGQMVCQCNVVPAEAVAEAIRAGATHRLAVSQRCGAGAVCGACHEIIQRMLQAAREGRDPLDAAPHGP